MHLNDNITYTLLLILIILATFYVIYNSSTENYYVSTTTTMPNSPDNITEINIIDVHLTPLKTILEKYKNLDIPITFTDNNTICNNWDKYSNNKYLTKENTCQIVDNSFTRKCLTGNQNVLDSCSNIYANGIIDNANAIDIDNIYNQAINKASTNYEKFTTQLSTTLTDINDKIINASKYDEITNAQESLINNNKISLEDKKSYNSKMLDQLENKIHKNHKDKLVYLDLVNQKEILDTKISNYKKIIIVMCIILFILCGIIYISSNIL